MDIISKKTIRAKDGSKTVAIEYKDKYGEYILEDYIEPKPVEKIVAFNPPTDWIREQVFSVGSSIGSVNFIKKSNGLMRKMCYKLHCKNPSAAKTPSGKSKIDRKAIDKVNNNLTVLDCNSVVRDKEGNIIGRGSWKSIPINNITRIRAKGKEIIINKY